MNKANNSARSNAQSSNNNKNSARNSAKNFYHVCNKFVSISHADGEYIRFDSKFTSKPWK